MSKEYTFTKEEFVHWASLDYAKGYLQQSMDRFVGTIIEERLGIKPTAEKGVQWTLDGNKIIVEDNDASRTTPQV